MSVDYVERLILAQTLDLHNLFRDIPFVNVIELENIDAPPLQVGLKVIWGVEHPDADPLAGFHQFGQQRDQQPFGAARAQSFD